MKKYTKLVIGALCVLSSTTLFAHEYKGYKGEMLPALTPVTIPNFNGGVEFSIEALYLKPTSTNLRYLTVLGTGTVGVVTTEFANQHDVDPEYGWGYQLGLGYVFPNSNSDVYVSWLHFDNDTDENLNVIGPRGPFVLNPGFQHDALGDGDVLFAEGEIDNDFDAVDLTFGHYVNFGPRLQTRMFGGLRYMQLKNELETEYTFLSTPADVTEVFKGVQTSKFNGLGPLFGIKGDYNSGWWGLGVTGMVDVALLVGEIDFSSNYNHFDFDEDVETHGSYNIDNTHIIAPGFDGKLGVNMKYMMSNGAAFALELGYQVTKYIDVIKQLDTDSFSTLAGDFVSADTDVTNFGLNGPYLALNVKL